MGQKLDNFRGVMRTPRTRAIFIITVILVILVAVVSFASLSSTTNTNVPDEVRGVSQIRQEARPDRQAGDMDPAYRDMFEEENRRTADRAEQSGSTAFLRIGDNPAPRTQAEPEPEPVPEPPRQVQPAPQTAPPPRPQPQRVSNQQQQPHPALVELIQNKWGPRGHHVAFENEPLALEPVAESGQPSSALPGAMPGGAGAALEHFYMPGDIAAATLVNSLNSDNPGPVIARIHTGALAGGTLVGQAASGANGVGVSARFDTLSMPDGRVYAIDARAMSEGDLSSLLASEVDRKIMTRFVLRPLAYFAKGMSEVLVRNLGNANVEVSDGVTIVNDNSVKMDGSEQIAAAAGIAAGELVSSMDDRAVRPTTHVHRNEVFGVLFMQRVDSSSEL